MSEVKLDAKTFHRRARNLLAFWKVCDLGSLDEISRRVACWRLPLEYQGHANVNV